MSPYLPLYSLFSHSLLSIFFISWGRHTAKIEEQSRFQLHPRGVSSVIPPLQTLLQATPISAHRVTKTRPCASPQMLGLSRLSPALTVLVYFPWGTLLSLGWPIWHYPWMGPSYLPQAVLFRHPWTTFTWLPQSLGSDLNDCQVSFSSD